MGFTDKRVLEVAKYIINNKATIKNAAEHFDLSISTVKKYINDYDKLQSVDYNAYIVVKEIQKELETQSQIKGGHIGKIGPSISQEESEIIARQLINNGWTLQEAKTNLNIPSSTIYDKIRNIKTFELQNEMDELFESNKKER